MKLRFQSALFGCAVLVTATSAAWLDKLDWSHDDSIDSCVDERVGAECVLRPHSCALLRASARAVKEKTGLRICLVGRSGVGKSSMVNALRGVRSSAADAAKLSHGVSGTGERDGFEFRPEGYASAHAKGVYYVDMPGSGTANFSTDTYARDVKLSEVSMDRHAMNRDDAARPRRRHIRCHERDRGGHSRRPEGEPGKQSGSSRWQPKNECRYRHHRCAT